MHYFTEPPALWGKLRAYDFPDKKVTVSFEDGSQCSFENSFFCKEGERFVVYTEHCGYYSFPLYAKLEGEQR